jgi:hypothetical protein
MKFSTVSIAFAAVLAFAQSAQAHAYHHHHHRHHVARYVHHRAAPVRSAFEQQYTSQWADASPHDFWNETHSRSEPTRRLGGRPAAWCGWEMRQLVGGDPGPEYNLARSWSHWGHAGPVGVGAVVVWRHHVGKIVGREDGAWIIESGNDGHRLRTRPRSLAGIIAVRWG